KHHGYVARHELAQGIAVGTVDFAVRFEIDVIASGNLVNAHRDRETLTIVNDVITFHFLDAQRVRRQTLVTVAVNRDAAGQDVSVPARDAERDGDRERENHQGQREPGHGRQTEIGGDQRAADQQIHHRGDDDGVFHSDKRDQDESADERADD